MHDRKVKVDAASRMVWKFQDEFGCVCDMALPLYPYKFILGAINDSSYMYWLNKIE